MEQCASQLRLHCTLPLETQTVPLLWTGTVSTRLSGQLCSRFRPRSRLQLLKPRNTDSLLTL